MIEPLFEIDVQRPPRGSRDASRLLYVQLRAAILAGRLPPGALLPATRRAPEIFGVSRNTGVEVYERLLNDGLVQARHGSGTRVADVLPGGVRASPASVDGSADGRLNPFWLSSGLRSSLGYWRVEAEALSHGPTSPVLEFRPAIVDPELFPQTTFRRLMSQQLRSLERSPPSYRSSQGNQGNQRLRTAITQHIAVTRGVVCHPRDVLVTAGAQQGFDVVARGLVTYPGMVVAVEEPGYPPMRAVFAAAGAQLVPVPVDSEGLIVDRLPIDARVICLCPSHQFPLGMSMSAERRRSLVAHARHHGAVIVEDDYDGEFRHDGAPLKALISEDAADVVFYVGTFSKCMLPALRLGFLIAPAWAMPTLVNIKNSTDWHCPTALQIAVAAFITEGHLARHVRKLRRLYSERRRVMMIALTGPLSRWLEPIPSAYGMHIAAIADATIDVEQAAEALGQGNLRLHTLARYYLDRPDRCGFVFGLGCSRPSEITAGVDMIKRQLGAS